MARGDSQLVPSAGGLTLNWRREGRGIDGNESEAFRGVRRLLDGQPVAGQRLPADDLAQVVGEVLERREAAGLRVEIRNVEAPAGRLAATVLAHQAIQPALETAGQAEVGAVDGQDQRVV